MQKQRQQGFTMIEIAIAVFIALLLLSLAIPSIDGVLADRRLRRSLDEINRLVTIAQEFSVKERRAYLIAWEEGQLVVRPESLMEGEDGTPVTTLPLQSGDAYQVKFPAALADEAPPEWIFWPSGTCEPAEVSYKGRDGYWAANFSALTARAELTKYAAR
jgi:prepilin-type N-terminal cleavage/methylation domain-containing protein